MRTALEIFQASPAAVGNHYNDLLNNPAFEPACSAALAAFVESLPNSAADPSKGWDAYLQIIGARAVLQQLSQLHIKPEKPNPSPPAWDYPKKGK